MSDIYRYALVPIVGVSSGMEAFAIVVLWPTFVIVVMIMIWVMPQRRFRFGTRSLFVSMTVVALLTGLAVYVSRK